MWNWLEDDSIHRVSGLGYLRELLKQPDVRSPGNVVWMMANSTSAELNRTWLRKQGIEVPGRVCLPGSDVCEDKIVDAALLERIERLRPQHVILTVGGGTQERVGLYPKQNLSYRPAIHCIGAAIAFLSGDQVRIPGWADRSYLGWLFRSVSEPKRYVPRYWNARKPLYLLVRYRERLPIPPV